MRVSCQCLTRLSRCSSRGLLQSTASIVAQRRQLHSTAASAGSSTFAVSPPFFSLAESANTSRRQLSRSSRRSFMSSPVEDAGPVETAIRSKLTETLKPVHLEVSNDSHLHAHHAAMRAQGGGNGESHFTVEVVSSAFEGKRQMQRHRLIYSTLQAELDAGLHALVIKAKTPKEAGMEEASDEAVEGAPGSAGEKVAAGP